MPMDDVYIKAIKEVGIRNLVVTISIRSKTVTISFTDDNIVTIKYATIDGASAATPKSLHETAVTAFNKLKLWKYIWKLEQFDGIGPITFFARYYMKPEAVLDFNLLFQPDVSFHSSGERDWRDVG